MMSININKVAVFSIGVLLPVSILAQCTEEAKNCQDGSSVMRNETINCEFNPCPGEGGINLAVEEEEEDMMMCTADVLECSDGSYVSRDPMDGCNFEPCPLDEEEATTKPASIDVQTPVDDDGSRTEETSCKFCQGDDDQLTDPTKMVYGKSCQEWYEMAISNEDAVGLSEDMHFGKCGEFQFLGSLCGCDNTSPENGCHMCPEDGELGNPERLLPDFDFFGMQTSITCEESRAMVQYTYPAGDDGFCPVQQSVMADYCGCSVANAKKCDICGDDVLSGGEAPPFTLIVGNSTSNITGYSCLDAEYVANVYGKEDVCNNIRDQVFQDCCESAMDGSIPKDLDSAAVPLFDHSFIVGSIIVGAICSLF